MSSTAGTETEPSPSRTGLTNTLTRSRRKKQKDRPGSSHSSLVIPDDASGKNLRRLRGSIDAAVDKIRPRTSAEQRRDSDSEGKSKADGGGLHDLLRRAKKKAKRDQEGEQQQEEAERGRSIAQRGTLQGAPESSRSSPSLSTTAMARSDSSLLTYDSETDSHPVPPPFTSRPSHAGYLTLSSPSVQPANEEDGSNVNPDASNGSSKAGPDGPVMTVQPAGDAAAEADIGDKVASSTPRYSVQPVLSNRANGGRATGSPAAQSRQHMNTSGTESRTTQPHSLLDSALPDGAREVSALGHGPDRSSGVEELRIPDDSQGSAPAGANRSLAASDTPNQKLGPSMEKPRLVTSSLRDANSLPTTPPSNALVTPVTTVTPPTPTDHRAGPANLNWDQANTKSRIRKTGTDSPASDPERTYSHRRVRSTSSAGTPSRLSRRISPPLTPTVEESRSALSTPGASGGSSGQGGFFSSVFSAAQNAASTLSSSIANTSLAGGNKSRGATQVGDDINPKLVKGDGANLSNVGPEREERDAVAGEDQPEQQKPLAVETLGMGELRLSHLGISEEPTVEETAASPVANRPSSSRSRQGELRNGVDNRKGRDGGSIGPKPDKVADPVLPSAVDIPTQEGSRMGAIGGPGSKVTSSINGESTASESRSVPVVEDVAGSRPRSMHDSGLDRASIPSTAADGEGEQEIKRTNSIRSKVDASFRRRREGSSATGTTTATATGTNATAATPVTPGLIPRLTGFAVASKKRNRDFHQLFKSVPEDDFLIEDYSAAIQKDILLHGRLYVSEGHICFNSNIFGYITTLVISFDEVVSVEKKNTAMVFPNAIVIQTLHARNVFASLASRESTYEVIVGIWKISHPNLRSSLNGVQLDVAEGGDKTIKAEESGSDGEGEDVDVDDEAVYDEDAEDGGAPGSLTDADEASRAGSEAADGYGKLAARNLSPRAPVNRTAAIEGQGGKDVKADGSTSPPSGVQDFPGPATHAPTECDDQDKHFDRIIRDETIAAPLGKVYSLIFGPSSGLFMSNWLQDEQKVQELQLEDDKMGLTEAKKARTYSYIKPLNASIGPKQTKCIITETLDSFDLEKAVSVTVITQTPDVPSGNVFSVRTKYCLTWAEGNSTRLFTNCTIDWTGKSWLKGPIEKGANEGQIVYTKELLTAIRAAVTARGPPATLGLKGRAKRRKKEISETIAQSSGKPAPGVASAGDSRQTKPENWGILEPIREPLSPVVNHIRPLLNTNVALVVMTLLLILSWLRPQGSYSRAATGSPYPGLVGPERLAAYETLWRQEENNLWDWLDERVGIDRLSSGALGETHRNQGRRDHAVLIRGRGVEPKLAEERMSERQICEAIRVTQQRLDDLKRIVDKRRDARVERQRSSDEDDSA